VLGSLLAGATLPFTGSNPLPTAIAGLALAAIGGVMLRFRRIGTVR
jgi:LPXTG-motif cell wall-anchored protein